LGSLGPGRLPGSRVHEELPIFGDALAQFAPTALEFLIAGLLTRAAERVNGAPARLVFRSTTLLDGLPLGADGLKPKRAAIAGGWGGDALPGGRGAGWLLVGTSRWCGLRGGALPSAVIG
jgi:hypothetical protein